MKTGEKQAIDGTTVWKCLWINQKEIEYNMDNLSIGTKLLKKGQEMSRQNYKEKTKKPNSIGIILLSKLWEGKATKHPVLYVFYVYNMVFILDDDSEHGALV